MFKWIRANWQSAGADQAFEAGDYALSFAEADKAVKTDPNCASGYYARARAGAYLDPTDLEQVQQDAERAIALEYDEDDVYEISAGAALARKDYPLCLQRAEQLLARNPKNGKGYNRKGLALFYLQRFAEAVPCFDQSLKYDFSPHDLHWRGHTKTFTGDIEGAVDDYGAALEHMPDNAFARRGRAEMLAVLGRFDESLAEFDRLLQIPDVDYACIAARGNLHQLLGQTREAHRDFREYLKRHSAALRSWNSPMRVPTLLLHAFKDLYEPGHVDNSAAVLLTFDQGLLNPLERLADVWRRARECSPEGDEIERQVADTLASDIAVEHRRKLLPLEFTEGAEVFVADICIRRCLLAEGRLDREKAVIEVAAEPAPGGRLAQLPEPNLAWLAER